MTTPQQVRLSLDRPLLEHPRALHIHRMRSAVWLYLVLASRTTSAAAEVAVDPPELGRAMGLTEGTIRGWLGHLRKYGYVVLCRRGRSFVASIRHATSVPVPQEPEPRPPPRYFTVAKLEHALGETGYRESLEGALAIHSDELIQRGLAGALAIPAAEIRRSRTALFLYLLKRHAQESTDDARA